MPFNRIKKDFALSREKLTPVYISQVYSDDDIRAIEQQCDVELGPVRGFKDVWVSRCGKVLKCHYPLNGDIVYYFGKLTTRRIDSSQVVILKGVDRDYTKTVPLLVAGAFLDTPEHVDRYRLVNQDGDFTNNHADNLKWEPNLTTFRKYIEVTDTRTGEIMKFITKKDFQSWVDKTFTIKRVSS